jgi:hypothetical protein
MGSQAQVSETPCAMIARFASNLAPGCHRRPGTSLQMPAVAGFRRGRFWVWLALPLFVTAQPGRADWWENVLQGGVTAAGATVPIFPKQQQTPVAVLRTGRIHTEWEQRGFFRIGVLPRVVLEDVILDLRATDDIPAAMNQVGERLSADRPDRCPVELRRFTLVTTTNAQPLLEAASVRFDRGRTSLAGIVLRREDGTTLRLRRALLTTDDQAQINLVTGTHRYPVKQPRKASDRKDQSAPTTPTTNPP